jgi:hypothetical protein
MARPRPAARAGYWERTLGYLSEKAQERSRDIAELIVQEIEHSPRTPVRKTNLDRFPPPGHLKGSFSVMDDPATGDVLIVTTARYWVFVEYGARGVAPQPFIANAVDTVSKAFD